MNGENVADGSGITPRLAERILAAGGDVITLGNRVWRRMEIGPYLETSDRIVRPANLARGTPGRGLTVAVAADGAPVAVVNLMGSIFHSVSTHPFEVVDALVDEARRQAEVVLVDIRVLPGGTAAITDAGMTGPHDSVIGVSADLAIRRMRTGLPVRFVPAEGDVRIEGAVVECEASGRATSCEALRVPVGP